MGKQIRLSRKMRVCSAAAVAVAVFAGAAITSDPALGRDDSLLRAVDVTMSGDGTVTAVKATSITTKASQNASSSTEDEYSPNKVVNDLPVRIVTSYRTEDSAGSDLSELNGYTGRVVIDVQVENLTLDSRRVSYDMNGNGYTTSALVGAPMTVIASASLGDTAASTVVVEGSDDTTNGLVSLDAEGNTQVQWGSLIAPPMLPATADLRLVVDAKNFSSPDFNISVQPGLATDSSSSALLDASAQVNSQIDLEERTIAAAAQVSEMLAQTSQTIQDVRSSLDTSAGTIGNQTLSDMQASTQSLTDTMSSVGSQLDGLKSSLQSASEQSSSQTLTQLASSVESMRAMLGDTSGASSDGQSVYATVQNVADQLQAYADAGDEQREGLSSSLAAAIGPENPSEENCQPVGAATGTADGGGSTGTDGSTPTGQQAARGTGGEAEAADTGTEDDRTPDGAAEGEASDSEARADAPSDAARGRQADDQAAGDTGGSDVRASGGTAPSGTSTDGDATGQPSATCALYQGQQSLNAAIDQFTSAAQEAIDGLSSQAAKTADGASGLAASAAGLQELASTVNTNAQDVKKNLAGGSETPGGQDLDSLGSDINALGDRITALTEAIDAAKTQADEGKTYNETVVSKQLEKTIEQVCAMNSEDQARLMPLLSVKDCADQAQNGDAETASVQALLAEENAKWQALSDSLDRNDPTDGIGKALSEYDKAYQALKAAHDKAKAAADTDKNTDDPGAAGQQDATGAVPEEAGDARDDEASGDTADLDQAVNELVTNAAAMQEQSENLAQQATTLSNDAAALNESVNGAGDGQGSKLQQAVSAAEVARRNSESIDTQIRQITQASRNSQQSLFDQSALSQSAQQMTEQAKSSIDAENQALADSYAQAQQSMEADTQQAQQAVADSIDRSAADLAGANALLGSDMAKLLADIGDPSVAGSGLLGALGTNAALAGTADTQLAVASGAMTGYANVRSTDLGGLLLRQAQMSAALEQLDELPLFQMRKPSGGTTNSVYVFSIEGSR
ncbi:hypothetical protein [Propionibacterium australiense]|uniref:6-Phosphogluconate Dehydrogenase-like n=1 Tax=Propionibacterium australiense TaxID=119981 RepID=A0A383S9X6_9ACTN|nr:hypothetical protein [Propionibacterium australiense]RLP06096.1 hypothetical protein D9T14_12760 [Propionibacterium australiense]SYZ34603.1 6-Phosphogluconate Dehydrogenase-like [Propionibacterium australiense]VEH89798.1 Uncharacterised protein [Propionibacterium australiense]